MTKVEQIKAWLDLFAPGYVRGSNYLSHVTSIDMGYVELWTANIHWDDEEKEIRFFTQYEPEVFCMEENCIHWPRSHWEDIVLDYQGETLWTQVEAV